MAMLHGPKHRQRLMVVGEALISKLMPLVVLMNFRVNDDILHYACHHHGLLHPNRTSLCSDLLLQSSPSFSNATYCFAAHSTLASVHHICQGCSAPFLRAIKHGSGRTNLTLNVLRQRPGHWLVWSRPLGRQRLKQQLAFSRPLGHQRLPLVLKLVLQNGYLPTFCALLQL